MNKYVAALVLLIGGTHSSLVSAEITVNDLHFNLAETWEVATEAPLGASLLAHGPNDASLAIAHIIEPDGLISDDADNHTAWIQEQVAKLHELLPNFTLVNRETIRAGGLNWEQIDYELAHLDLTYQQRCLITIRIAGGVHEAWIMTFSQPKLDGINDTDWLTNTLHFKH